MEKLDASGNERKGIEVFSVLTECWFIPKGLCRAIAETGYGCHVAPENETWKTVLDLMRAGF